MITWPIAFGLTLLVEGLVLVAICHRDCSLVRILAAAILANACTHPVVYLVLPGLFADWGTYLVVAEAFAFAVEVPLLWLVLRPVPWTRAITASALANASSYVLGLLLWWAM